ALLQSTERQLERIADAIARKPAKHDAAAIGLAVGSVIDEHKVRKHFGLKVADGRFAFRWREDEIAAEARLDGIYGVRTSHPADKLGSEQAVAAYKSLAVIERAFRTMKGVGYAGAPRPSLALDTREGTRVPVHAGLLRSTPHAPGSSSADGTPIMVT